MPRFDSAKAMQTSLNAEGHKPCWQCQNCGKIYRNYEELSSSSCAFHPNGRYKGYCDCGKSALLAYETVGKLWETAALVKERNEERRRRQLEADKRAIMLQLEQHERRIFEARKVLFEGKNVSDENLYNVVLEIYKNWENEKSQNTRADLLHSINLALKQKYVSKGLGDAWNETLEKLYEDIKTQNYWGFLYILLRQKITSKDGRSKCYFGSLCYQDIQEFIDAIVLFFWKGKSDGGRLSQLESSCQNDIILLEQDLPGSNVDKSWLSQLNHILDHTLHDPDFWYELFCLIRLELDPEYGNGEERPDITPTISRYDMFPNAKTVQDIPLFELIDKVYMNWDDVKSQNTRKLLVDSIDSAIAMKYKKKGLDEEWIGTLEEFKMDVQRKPFWEYVYVLMFQPIDDTETNESKKILQKHSWNGINTLIDINVYYFWKNFGNGWVLESLKRSFSAQAKSAAKGYSPLGIDPSWAETLADAVDNVAGNADFWYKLYCFVRLEFI